ncbi:MAG: glycoside hydrolase family 31 protein [Deltaproteobacteria bacterium]|nr:glycoside hydrolase family 31 protein [Deltaproteobacteria bacterium]
MGRAERVARAGLVALAALAALAPGAAGCGETAELAAAQGFALGPEPYTLDVANDGRTVTLRRRSEPIVVLDPDAFQLGIVETLDDQKSYDPWDIERRGYEEAGITWRSPVLATSRIDVAARRGELQLDFGDGLLAHVIVDDEGGGGFRFVFVPGDASGAGATAPGKVPVLARVRVRTLGNAREGFYGLGEWQDAVDHRGKVRAMQIEADLEIESANNEAHVPVPFLVGTHGWAMFVDSDRVGIFDVAKKSPSVVETTFAIASTAGEAPASLPVWLFAGEADRPLDLVKACYRVGGPIKLPAPWALGPWIWRDENADQREVLSDIATIRKLDLATSGVWIDRPYATAVNTFDFDAPRFPDPPAMIREAHRQGLMMGLWSTPYLEPAAEPLRSRAMSSGYFPPGVGIPFNKWSAPIDFTNPDASTFWTSNVRKYVAMGIDGFKLDYGEDVVPSLADRRNVWRFAAGDERTMHFHFSSLYHRAYGEALERPEGAFLLCRAAHFGEQSNGCIIWPGDMDATFTRHRERFVPRGSKDGKEVVGVGGLPATVAMGLGLGVSGFPFFGADTGGYRHSPPDRELWIRWVEQTALSSVMQVGDSSSQPPWVFTPENERNDESVDVYRAYARLHLRLFPYEWTYAKRIAIDGKPIQRPLGLAYPELGAHPYDAYMFGDDLLVAPVVNRGETRRDVLAPAGTWIDWWDGTTYTSDARLPLAIDAPLYKLPLLLRDGAIVPMLRPNIDTLSPAEDPAVDSFARDPGVLWARTVPGRPRRFELWDRTRIERTNDGSIELASGDVFAQGFLLESIATPLPREIVREEESGAKTVLPALTATSFAVAVEGWTWEPAKRGTLLVKTRAGRARLIFR